MYWENIGDIQKARINANIEDSLVKAEGARGGKVIGHTKSGKPIYESHEQEHTQHYTAEDHSDAVSAHTKSSKEAGEKADFHNEKMNHHDRMAQKYSDNDQFSKENDSADRMHKHDALEKEHKERSQHHSSMAELHHGAMNSKFDKEASLTKK